MDLLPTMRLLHLIGIAWGVGGGTVGLILMMKSQRNPEIAPQIGTLMPTVSRLVMLGLALSGLSGLAIVQIMSYPLSSLILTAKIALAVIIVPISIVVGRKSPKAAGALGLAFWYIIFVLGVLM